MIRRGRAEWRTEALFKDIITIRGHRDMRARAHDVMCMFWCITV